MQYNINILQFKLIKKQYYKDILKSFNFWTIFSFLWSRKCFKSKNLYYICWQSQFLLKNILSKIKKQKFHLYLNNLKFFKKINNKKKFVYYILNLKKFFFYKRELALWFNIKFYTNFFKLRIYRKKKPRLIKINFLSLKGLSRLFKKKKI